MGSIVVLIGPGSVLIDELVSDDVGPPRRPPTFDLVDLEGAIEVVTPERAEEIVEGDEGGLQPVVEPQIPDVEDVAVFAAELYSGLRDLVHSDSLMGWGPSPP